MALAPFDRCVRGSRRHVHPLCWAPGALPYVRLPACGRHPPRRVEAPTRPLIPCWVQAPTCASS